MFNVNVFVSALLRKTKRTVIVEGFSEPERFVTG